MSGEFVKAGYLVKSPPEFKALVAQWHKRWFLLMDSRLVYPLAARYVRLEYYQSEQEAKRLGDPKGVINLNTCTQVNSREPMKGHRHVFDIHTEERIYHLVAESGEEKQEWIDTLKTLLFTPQTAQSPGRQRKWSPPQQHDKIILRSRGSSQKQQRPLSFACPPTTTPATSGASQRPLPPVPNGSPPARPSRLRPLPPTPPDNPPTPSAVPEQKANSPKPKKRKAPPPKPPPYRKANSGPTTLNSKPAPVDITGLYDVAPGQSSVMVHPSPVPSKKILIGDLEGDEDYSVLENANVQSPAVDGDMYSRLDPTNVRRGQRSLPEQVQHSKGVHNVIVMNDDDYSLLQH